MLLSVVIMAVLLVRVDWEHFAQIADRINIGDLFLSFSLLFIANFIRSMRFQILDHTGNRLSDWWVMNQIYNLITVTLPGGPGDLAAVYLLKKCSKLKMLSAFRIFLLTRIMDFAGLGAMLLITALMISETTPHRTAAILVAGIVFIFSMITVYPKCERFIIRMFQKIPIKGRIMNRLYEKLDEIAEISKDRFSSTVFGTSMIQSALIVIVLALSMHFLLRSFGTEFILIQSIYCFGVYGLFQLVPVHGIAGIGTQTAWWSLAINVAGYQAADTIAIAIVLHGTIYMFSVIYGLLAMFYWMLVRRPDQSFN